jgi:mannose-6-phosphate isomerase-like protein (cupin superfamily)
MAQNSEPVSLAAALASFTDLWSPRIVTTVNDYDVRVAKVEGEHLWHTHDHTDEFFLVLEGELHIALRESGGERTVVLPKGSRLHGPARHRAQAEYAPVPGDPRPRTDRHAHGRGPPRGGPRPCGRHHRARAEQLIR